MHPWLRCFFGPPLYRIYATGASEAYNRNFFERHADTVLATFRISWQITIYLSPFLLIYFYRRGNLGSDFAIRVALFAGLAGGGAWLVRGLGRLSNPQYVKFAGVFELAKRSSSSEKAALLHRYDFGFEHWPVDYVWQDAPAGEKVRSTPVPVLSYRKANFWGASALCWLAAHSFGRRLVYPGAVGLMNTLLSPMLEQGRIKLLEEFKGRRFKLQTRHGRAIESMFVDRRNDSRFTANGSILVISCEGNAGYLEIGCMTTPLEAGYSVLGWNHPGFSGSEGDPWPDQEREAIDVVLQFARHGLKWDPRQIVFFGWSIGGFTASWAVSQNPDIRAAVLDATFDEVMPLAKARMPISWEPLVEQTVIEYLDLPIGRQLLLYDGPVALIRRTRDEIIHTDPDKPLESNRANDLLKLLLFHRYPELFKDPAVSGLLDGWLAAKPLEREALVATVGVEAPFWEEFMRAHVRLNGPGFPMHIGANLRTEDSQRLAVFLASHYFIDFDNTHCTPLPSSMFAVPRHPWERTKLETEE